MDLGPTGGATPVASEAADVGALRGGELADPEPFRSPLTNRAIRGLFCMGMNPAVDHFTCYKAAPTAGTALTDVNGVATISMRAASLAAGGASVLEEAQRDLLSLPGVGMFALLCDAPNVCVWVGSSAIERVCACSPPRSPSVWPLPTWIGALPLRSGSAKLTRPRAT